MSEQLTEQARPHIQSGVDFVPPAQARQAVLDAGVPRDQADAVVRDYAEAQLTGLKIAFLATAAIVLASFPFTRNIHPLRGECAGTAGDDAEACPTAE